MSEMYDTHGKMLYNMAEKLIAIHKTITCESEHGKEVIKCKKKWSSESSRFILRGGTDVVPRHLAAMSYSRI